MLVHIKDWELSPTWPQVAWHWLYEFVAVTEVNNNNAERKSLKLETHLEINDIEPVCFLFLPFPWHGCVPSSEAAQWPLMVVTPGSSYWKCDDLHTRSGDMFVVEVDSVQWEHKGRPLRTEKRGGLYGTADASDISNSQMFFPLISQWLQSSTEKAATRLRSHLDFSRLSYSAEHTNVHTSKNTLTWTSTHGLGQSPKADFSDNQSVK